MTKSWVEWYLQLPAAEPGEGIDWKVHWAAPWPDFAPGWLIVLVGIAAIALIVRALRADAHALKPWQQAILIGLRLCALASAVVIAAQPEVSVRRTGLPTLAILVDTSASMTLPATAGRTPAPTDQPPATRLQAVQSALLANRMQTLRELSKRYSLALFQFSDASSRVSSYEPNTDSQFEQVARSISTLSPNGSQTIPAAAIRGVQSDLRGRSLAAIVTLTDGVASTSQADRFSAAAVSLREKNVQLFPIGLGATEPTLDAELADALVDEFGIVGDPLPIAVRVKSFGLAGKSGTVRVVVAGTNPPIVQEQWFTFPANGVTLPVELGITIAAAGSHELAIEVAPHPDEPEVSNNRLMRTVTVRDNKIRVLLADSRPRYEFRFLKSLLEREASIELKHWLSESDVTYSSEDKTALKQFPARREELFWFDVVLWGDLGPKDVSPDVLATLAAFVQDRGGTAVFIAGTRSNPWALGGTALEPLLPFEVGAIGAANGAVTASSAPISPFRMSLTTDGLQTAAVFRIAGDETASRAAWNQLPVLRWLVPVRKLKPGAVVLAEHPVDKSAKGLFPVVVLERFGAGKVWYQLTDETWRWRFRQGDQFFGRYWNQLIRFAARSRLLGQDRSAELVADRQTYDRGEPVRLELRFFDERLVPTQGQPAEVRIESPGQPDRKVTLEQTSRTSNGFSGQVFDLPPAPYRAIVTRPAFPERAPSVEFRVELPQRELTERSQDQADLQAAASITRGSYLAISDYSRLPEILPEGIPVFLEAGPPLPLWSRWEVLLAIATCLGMEWGLRKRWQLL